MDEGANAHTPGPYLDDGEHRRVQSGAAHRPQSLATLQLSHAEPPCAQMHVTRDMGRACFSRVAGTPDNAPASPRVLGVPAEWRALSEYTLNEGQEQTMAALAMGGNVLSRQPTGSGKSYTYLLPAIAQWAAIARARARCADERTRDKLPLPPICIVVAPFCALCEDAEYQASLFLAGLYEAELLPTVSVLNRQSCARALFVDRFVDGGVVEMLASTVVSDSTSAVVAAADAAPTVDSLPCGRCSSCTDGKPDKCWWSCRVACPGERPDARWCRFCNTTKADGRRVSGCEIHRAAKQRRASGAPTFPSASLPTRRPSTSATATAATHNAAEMPPTPAPPSPRPLRMEDLPLDAPERAIVEDASLAIVYVTPDALRATSDRGALLRHAIARSGRCSLLVVDEAHTCLHISQGGFREACAQLGVTCAALASAMEARGFERFQVLALTATLPPGKLEREVMTRLRLGREGDDCTVLRGPVDRESITMTRCFLPEHDKESSARYVLRAWRLLLHVAPSYAKKGRRVAFVTKAMGAPIIADYLTSKGFPACAFATNGMSPDERAGSLRDWRGDLRILLIASSTFATGVNESGITLVVHFGLAQDPLEHVQEDGRIRGTGLSVTFVRARYLIERAMLPAPMDRARVALNMAVQLVKLLTHPGCLRCAIVGWLGGTVTACSGCDCCVRDGSASQAAECCGSFPYLMELRPARLAAIEILRSLMLTDQQLLTRLLEAPPDEAPAPFGERSNHEAVVLSLIGKGQILLTLRESSSGLAPLLLASASPSALSSYEAGEAELFVWLWRPAPEPLTLPSAAEMAEATQLIKMHQMQVQFHRRAMRRLTEVMLRRGATLTDLGLCAQVVADLTNLATPTSSPSSTMRTVLLADSCSPALSQPTAESHRMPPSPEFHIRRYLKSSAKRTPSKIAESPEVLQHRVSGERDEVRVQLPFPVLDTETGAATLSPELKAKTDVSCEAIPLSPGRRLVSAAKRLLRT